MIIDSHAVQATSSHNKSTVDYQSTRVSGSGGSAGIGAFPQGPISMRGGIGDMLILSEEGMQSLAFSREQGGSFSFSSSFSSGVVLSGTREVGPLEGMAASEEEMAAVFGDDAEPRFRRR